MPALTTDSRQTDPELVHPVHLKWKTRVLLAMNGGIYHSNDIQISRLTEKCCKLSKKLGGQLCVLGSIRSSFSRSSGQDLPIQPSNRTLPTAIIVSMTYTIQEVYL